MLVRAAAVSIATLTALAVLAPHAAADVPNGTYVYKIEHQDHGDIGTHTIRLGGTPASRVANVKLDIKVKVLLITAHRETASRSEIWKNGKLAGYASSTRENKKTLTVAIKRNGANLEIVSTTPKKTDRRTAPSDSFLTNPWDIAILKAKTVIDTKTGAVKTVKSVTKAGEETVRTGRGPVKATKYLFIDDGRRELWYDANKRLVKFVVVNDGKRVTFTLQ